MPDLSAERLQQIIAELDAAIPREGSKCIFDGDSTELETGGTSIELIGNRNGFLRLGIEMLNAATMPIASHERFVPVSAEYLAHGLDGIIIKRFTRVENPESLLTPRGKAAARYPLLTVGFLGIVLFAGFCTVIGFVQMLHWWGIHWFSGW